MTTRPGSCDADSTISAGDGQYDVFSAPELVGREQALAALLDAVTDLPSIVLVEGEAGIGKTRLVAEVLKHPSLRETNVLVGHCYASYEPFPLGPVVEALAHSHIDFARLDLSPLSGALVPLLPDRSHQLAPPLERLGEAAAERHRLFRALLEVFTSLGTSLLVLEDVHWLDATTFEFLRFLLTHHPAALSVVATFRPEGTPAPLPFGAVVSRLPPTTRRTVLSLSPLSRTEVQSVIESILGTGVSSEFADYVYERAGGVPFPIEEILRLLHERRDLTRWKGGWARRELEELRVPAAVRDSILERIRWLSPEALRIVEAAAVLGVPSGEMVLAGTADLEPARARLAVAEAISAAFLEAQEGRYPFRHALTQQAVYDGIAAPQRAHMHLSAAQSLLHEDEPNQITQLAHHYKQANEIDAWTENATKAADFAISVGDDAGAVQLLRDVTQIPELEPVRRAQLAIKLGEVALDCLDHVDVIPVVREVLVQPLPCELRGQLRVTLGLLLLEAGDAAALRHELTAAVADLSEHPNQLVRPLRLLAVPWGTEAHVSEHRASLEQALAAGRGLADPEIETSLLVDRANLLLAVGDPEAWSAVAALPSDKETLTEQRQWVRANLNFGFSAFLLGHYERAQAFLDEGVELSVRSSYDSFALYLEANQILLNWVTGRWDGLYERAGGLVESAAEASPATRLEGQLAIGLLRLARGELSEAEQALSLVTNAAAPMGQVPTFVIAVAARSRLLLARGDAQAAAWEATTGVDIALSKGIALWASEALVPAVNGLVAAARTSDAEQRLLRFAEGIVETDTPLASAMLDFGRGLVVESRGSLEEAARSYASAATKLSTLPRPYDAAAARERYGRCLTYQRDGNGEAALLEALETFESLGASWDAARVRHHLRRHGVSLTHRRGRKGYGTALSPREEEVVRLAAKGLSNKEIAQDLYLSTRTIEDHLARAMRKLGVDSRRALAGPQK